LSGFAQQDAQFPGDPALAGSSVAGLGRLCLFVGGYAFSPLDGP
jgi:hypothetical protein